MVKLTVGTEVDEDIADMIGEGLDEYNIERGGPYNHEELWILARDDDGTVLGGLKGHTGYSWMYVDWLWISPENRKAGLGSQLDTSIYRHFSLSSGYEVVAACRKSRICMVLCWYQGPLWPGMAIGVAGLRHFGIMQAHFAADARRSV